MGYARVHAKPRGERQDNERGKKTERRVTRILSLSNCNWDLSGENLSGSATFLRVDHRGIARGSPPVELGTWMCAFPLYTVLHHSAPLVGEGGGQPFLRGVVQSGEREGLFD